MRRMNVRNRSECVLSVSDCAGLCYFKIWIVGVIKQDLPNRHREVFIKLKCGWTSRM